MISKKTNIVIVGLGYVGLPLALLVKKAGYNIIGIVRNSKKAELINKGICPFKDLELSKQLKKYRINATIDYSVIKNADIVILCIPTPVNSQYYPDLEPLISVSAQVGKYIKPKSLVILESTVNPGATESVLIPIIEMTSHLKAGIDFLVSHSPERINPGDKTWNVTNIPRVVGSLTEEGLNKTLAFYRSVLKGQIKPMKSIKAAEAVKIVENCFRDINIAFVNELAMSFANLDIDISDVLEGASTKPFAFIKHLPGCGVGGHCIPVDPYYMIDYANQKGFQHNFLSLARKINNNMPRYTVDLLIKELNKLNIHIKKTKVAVLGLAYKADIDDIRESPSLAIIKHLHEEGITYDVFDPYVLEKSTVKSLNEALKNKIAVIIATNHKQFLNLTPQILKKNGIKIVIDGRNCLDKELFIKNGIYYKGIGR